MNSVGCPVDDSLIKKRHHVTPFVYLIAPLAGHDVQHQFVCLVHAFRTDESQIADAAVHIVIDDTFDRGDAFVLHGQYGGEYSGRYSAGKLQCTTGLGTIAYHTGDVGNHVLLLK